MGAVIMFPQALRGSCETLAGTADADAAVIILPAIRIERAHDEPADSETETTKSPSGRRRRKRATRPGEA